MCNFMIEFYIAVKKNKIYIHQQGWIFFFKQSKFKMKCAECYIVYDIIYVNLKPQKS